MILIATVFGLASNNVLIAACHYGYGLHGKVLTKEAKKKALMCFYLSQMFYKASINTTKASILLLYLRIFVQKQFRMICWILMGFVIAFGISTTVASVFQCTPIPRTYDKSIPGHCINTTIFWYTNAAISILGDFIIIALPMPLILGLRLQLNQKLSLLIVFALGIFVIITSVLRMTTLNTTSKTPDPTFEIGATMWTILELNIAIVCACLPMCRMPLAKLFPKIFPSTGSSHPNTTAFTHAGTSKNDWTPSTHDRGHNRSHLASVAGGDNNSEEFILQDRNGTHLHPIGGERIQKTTQFEVRYEDNSSDLSGESTPAKVESKFDPRA